MYLNNLINRSLPTLTLLCSQKWAVKHALQPANVPCFGKALATQLHQLASALVAHEMPGKSLSELNFSFGSHLDPLEQSFVTLEFGHNRHLPQFS